LYPAADGQQTGNNFVDGNMLPSYMLPWCKRGLTCEWQASIQGHHVHRTKNDNGTKQEGRLSPTERASVSAHFGLPGYASGTIAVIVTWMERGFNAGQTHSSIYPSIFNRLRAIAKY